MSAMRRTSPAGLPAWQFPALADAPGLVHAFVGKPCNWAPHRGRGRETAVDHRRALCTALGLDFDRLTSPAQVHGAELLTVEDVDVGCGRFGRAEAVPFVDGLLTDRTDAPLILLSADCPLVLIYDAVRAALAIAHASWLGTVAGITTRLVAAMRTSFGSDPSALCAAIAPSAGPCCYEVGAEVLRIFRTRMPDADRFFVPRGGKFMLDLWAANRAQLEAAGVPPERIESAGVCTICDASFWSHRRDGADAGRNALIAALR